MGNCTFVSAANGNKINQKTILRDYNLTRHEQTVVTFNGICQIFDNAYALLPRNSEYAAIFGWKPTDTIVRLVIKFQDGPGPQIQGTDYYLLDGSDSASQQPRHHHPDLSVNVMHVYPGPEQTVIDTVKWCGLSFDCQTFLLLSYPVIPMLQRFQVHTLTVLVDFNLTRSEYQSRESVLDAFSQQPFCLRADPLQAFGQVIAPPHRFWPTHWQGGSDLIVRYICMPRMSWLVYSCVILSQPQFPPQSQFQWEKEHQVMRLSEHKLVVQPQPQPGLSVWFLNRQLVGIEHNQQVFIPFRFGCESVSVT